MVKSNAQVAAFFRRMAELLELKGDNPFKSKSYRTAADAVEEMREPIASIARESGVAGLQQLPGIGRSISAQIAEFVASGTSGAFEALRLEIPETVAELLRVRGVGLKTAQTLYRDFGVLGVDDLHAFAAGGGLDVVPGLADRSASKIVQSAGQFVRDAPRMPLRDAARLADTLAAEIEKAAGPTTIAGEVRRGRDPVRSLGFLVVADDVAHASSAAARIRGAADLLVVTPGRVQFTASTRVPATVLVVSPAARWPALVRATGSTRHVRELEDFARARGMAFRLDGLFEGTERVELDGEEDFYAALGLEFIPPEAREGTGEIEAAAAPA